MIEPEVKPDGGRPLAVPASFSVCLVRGEPGIDGGLEVGVTETFDTLRLLRDRNDTKGSLCSTALGCSTLLLDVLQMCARFLLSKFMWLRVARLCKPLRPRLVSFWPAWNPESSRCTTCKRHNEFTRVSVADPPNGVGKHWQHTPRSHATHQDQKARGQYERNLEQQRRPKREV